MAPKNNMNITLTDLGKKFNRRWIFRHLDLEIASGEMLAITGHNGSGKSTLLKIIGNYISPSEGRVHYQSGEITHPQTSFSFVAPYQNLIEEFTLLEHLNFHSRFRNGLISQEEIMEKSGLVTAKHQLIREFSSGMKQRLKLALAFFYQCDVIFLDEPTSNLDQNGVDWYLSFLDESINRKTIIIASNDAKEYELARQIISMEEYKS